MSLDSKPRSKARSRQGGGEMSSLGASASVHVKWPTTSRQWEAWRRKRDRYRLAIAMWAVERAHADPFGFNQRRELRQKIRALGLRLQDDEDLYEKHKLKSAPRHDKRAMIRLDRVRG